MDHLKKICFPLTLIGVFMAPVASAASNEAEYTKFVEGALSVYKQFKEPSVKESNKFLSFVNSRWKANNEVCLSGVCEIDGRTAAKAYAYTHKVKLENEIQ